MKKLIKVSMCFLLMLGLSGTNLVKAMESQGGKDNLNTNEDTTNDVSNTGGQIATFAVDINKPVVEKIEFPDNNKKVEAGSSIPIYVTAYDADSGIDEVRVDVQFKGENGTNNDYSRYFFLTLNESTKRYEGYISIEDKGYVSAYINSVRARDKNGNYAYGTTQESNIYLYKCEILKGSYEDEIVDLNKSDLVFLQNHKTIDRTEKLSISITIPEEVSQKYEHLWVSFTAGATNFSVKLNKEEVNSNKYTASYDFSNRISEGKYVLDEIYATNGETPINGLELRYKDKENVWFTLGEKEDNVKPVIESVEMDKKGTFVKANDSLAIRIKASDNVSLEKYKAEVLFAPKADVDQGYTRVTLRYDEETGEYVGTLKITDDMYPCEWYMSKIEIRDSSDNLADYSQFISSNWNTLNDYYIKVNNNGTFVNPTYNINFTFYALNNQGDYEEVGKWKKDNIERRTTLTDAGIIFPEVTATYKGLVFKGWKDINGNIIDSNSQVFEGLSNSGSLYAYYDKMVINNSYTYPNADLDLTSVYDKLIIPYGITYREAIASASEKNLDVIYKGEEFTGWGVSENFLPNGENMDSVIKFRPNNYMNLKATFKNKKVVSTYRGYYNEEGRRNEKSNVLFVDNNSTYKEVYDSIDKSVPNLFDGLRFKEWTNNYVTEDIVKDYENVWTEAVYNNCIVRFILDNRIKGGFGWAGFGEPDFEYIHAIVVEKGETITVPEISGYKNIEWLSDIGGDSLIINASRDFLGWGDKDGEPIKPETPDIPEEPTKPSTGSSLPDNVIQNIISNINNAQDNEEIEIIMGKATIVPKDILENIKGRNINIKLNMGDYTWVINGKDVLGSNLSNINLEVAFDKNAIPSKTVSELAGDNPVKQLSLTHNGDFGFKAKLSFNIGSDNKDKFGNLYYYDSEGKLVFMNAGKIGEDGNVSLDFSHASDYVIIIKDKVMDVPEKDDSNAIKATSQGGMNSTQGIAISLLALVIVGTAVTMKRKHS